MGKGLPIYWCAYTRTDANQTLTTMRTFREIAIEIKSLWKNMSPYAMPYVRAMLELPTSEPSANYGCEQASEQVVRFLANASGWRGSDARRIKAELKAMIGM